MGVDFSTTIAYGMKVDDVSFIPDYEDIDDGNDWLADKGYSELEFDIAGNLMNGEYHTIVYLSGYYYRLGQYGNEEDYIDLETDIDDDLTSELDRLREFLGLPPEAVGWKVIFNVF